MKVLVRAYLLVFLILSSYMSKVTVLLPVYNGEPYLRRSIESLLQQTSTRWKLLVRDDGSTDRSLNVIRSFDDSRIRVLDGDSQLGLFGNLNALLEHVDTPLVRFFCQDDILEPNCIARELQFFEDHSEVGMSFCKLKSIDGEGRVIDEGPIEDIPSVIEAPKSLLMLYYWGCLPANLSTVCVRRSCLEATGGFNETYEVSGDYDLWARLCQRWPLGVIHEHLARVRTHAEQLSQATTSNTAFVEEDRRVRREELFPHLPEDLKSYARWHERLRQNVSHTNRALQSIWGGNLRHATQIWQSQGSFDAIIGLVTWAATLNNRLYMPSPKFSTENRNP